MGHPQAHSTHTQSATMAMSGVQLADGCVEAFKELKLKHNYQYLMFEVNGDTIDLTEKGAKGSSYDDFYAKLQGRTKEPCYVIYDFQYKDKEGKQKDKLVLINWVPEGSPSKLKMLYTASKEAIKKPCNGIGIDIQATD